MTHYLSLVICLEKLSLLDHQWSSLTTPIFKNIKFTELSVIFPFGKINLDISHDCRQIFPGQKLAIFRKFCRVISVWVILSNHFSKNVFLSMTLEMLRNSPFWPSLKRIFRQASLDMNYIMTKNRPRKESKQTQTFLDLTFLMRFNFLRDFNLKLIIFIFDQ